jgi:hypothetical protein
VQLELYGLPETELEVVAVVLHVGVTVGARSPFSRPVYPAVMTGTVPPYVIDPLEAVMVSGAGVTTTEPGT